MEMMRRIRTVRIRTIEAAQDRRPGTTDARKDKDVECGEIYRTHPFAFLCVQKKLQVSVPVDEYAENKIAYYIKQTKVDDTIRL